MKFLVAQFMHETNTFCGIRPGREEFAAREYYEGEDIPTHLRGTRTMVGAFIDFAEANDVELIWTIDAFATPAGIVQRTFYEEMVARILDAVTDDVDGVLLSLHGAMVVEDIDDGEGEFLARLRQRVGRDCPIATVLDFHTNLSPAMVANADVLVGYKHYPHIDMYEAGMSAATLLHRCVRGEIHPVRHAKYIPILAPLGHTSTFDEPMKSIVLREEEMEAMAGVLSVSVFGGFPYADIPDAGMSALVM